MISTCEDKTSDANSSSSQQSNRATAQHLYNQPETVAQRKLQQMADSSIGVTQLGKATGRYK